MVVMVMTVVVVMITATIGLDRLLLGLPAGGRLIDHLSSSRIALAPIPRPPGRRIPLERNVET